MTTETELAREATNQIDPEALVKSLTAKNGLPEEALRKCQRHRELVTPYLIRSIEEANARVRGGGELETDAPWLAFYLLWEFRAKEALPAILAAVPGETGYVIFCDAITESLPAVLATLADDNLAIIEEYIANREHDQYSRSSAAGSYLYLVRDGVVSRAEAVSRLRQHLRNEFDKPRNEFASFLLTTLCDLYPHEAREDIDEAYQRNVIIQGMIDVEYVEAALNEGEEGFQLKQAELGPTHLSDTVELLREFGMFQPKPVKPPVERLPLSRLNPGGYGSMEPRYTPRDVDDESFSTNTTTIRNGAVRVGRNDPCPCGSGKKYKKCCLRESPS